MVVVHCTLTPDALGELLQTVLGLLVVISLHTELQHHDPDVQVHVVFRGHSDAVASSPSHLVAAAVTRGVHGRSKACIKTAITANELNTVFFKPIIEIQVSELSHLSSM